MTTKTKIQFGGCKSKALEVELERPLTMPEEGKRDFVDFPITQEMQDRGVTTASVSLASYGLVANGVHTSESVYEVKFNFGNPISTFNEEGPYAVALRDAADHSSQYRDHGLTEDIIDGMSSLVSDILPAYPYKSSFNTKGSYEAVVSSGGADYDLCEDKVAKCMGSWERDSYYSYYMEAL